MLKTPAQKKKAAEATKDWRRRNPMTEEEKAAAAEYSRLWRENNPEKYKESQDSYNTLKRRTQNLKKYGITPDQYDEMLSEQNDVCFICSDKCSTGARLCVDHNHDTGKVRKLLCIGCNRRVGKIECRSDIAMRIKAYVLSDGETCDTSAIRSLGETIFEITKNVIARWLGT